MKRVWQISLIPSSSETILTLPVFWCKRKRYKFSVVGYPSFSCVGMHRNTKWIVLFFLWFRLTEWSDEKDAKSSFIKRKYNDIIPPSEKTRIIKLRFVVAPQHKRVQTSDNVCDAYNMRSGQCIGSPLSFEQHYKISILKVIEYEWSGVEWVKVESQWTYDINFQWSVS